MNRYRVGLHAVPGYLSFSQRRACGDAKPSQFECRGVYECLDQRFENSICDARQSEECSWSRRLRNLRADGKRATFFCSGRGSFSGNCRVDGTSNPRPAEAGISPQPIHLYRQVTLYVLDKNGEVRSQHTDTYYITPTAYEFFTLHVSHDGKAISQKNLNEQQRKIEKQIKDEERKAQKNESFHPKDQLLFAEIIARSTFTPLRWDQIHGSAVVVYAFEPKSKARPSGISLKKIAGDLKGKMWISPEEKEVLRIEFASVAPPSLGFLGNVRGFQGVTEPTEISRRTLDANATGIRR